MTEPASNAADLLANVTRGDSLATERLLPLVYDELRGLARSYLRRQQRPGTLQTTALVHEAFVRLLGHKAPNWESRAHFFAVAATAMRQVLSNHARDRRAAKRGGAWQRIDLSQAGGALDGQFDLLELDDALSRLAELDPQQYRVAELRMLTGMTVAEITTVLGLSKATVEREWRAARAWLGAELYPEGGA